MKIVIRALRYSRGSTFHLLKKNSAPNTSRLVLSCPFSFCPSSLHFRSQPEAPCEAPTSGSLSTWNSGILLCAPCRALYYSGLYLNHSVIHQTHPECFFSAQEMLNRGQRSRVASKAGRGHRWKHNQISLHIPKLSPSSLYSCLYF